MKKNKNENCLNCIFLDKVNRCCSIEEDNEFQYDYELEATWCTSYEKEISYPINLISAKDIRRIYED